MITGRIHSTESFGAVDGPGIRFLIFMQGCRMRCQYCHNADTWDTDGGEERSVPELLNRAERYRSYWRDKGGITVSGGEPLLQTGFLLELFREAKRRNIHTALDTAAQPFTRKEPFFGTFRELMQYTDLVLLDIKRIDPEGHRRLTGHGNANILDCARYLSETGKPVWIRHVLVPGLTDNDADLYRVRAFLDTLANVEKVEVLPYHTLGADKWARLGLEYPLKGVEPPTEERIENARRILTIRQS